MGPDESERKSRRGDTRDWFCNALYFSQTWPVMLRQCGASAPARILSHSDPSDPLTNRSAGLVRKPTGLSRDKARNWHGMLLGISA